MRIIDCSADRHLECAVQAVPQNGGPALGVAAEHRMEIIINERPAMRVVCTPEHLGELVLGRLLTEGLIGGPGDIEEIYICEMGTRARVLLRKEAAAQLTGAESVDIGTCCTDNRTLLAARTGMPHVRPIVWERDWLLRAAERMRREEPLYGATHAAHGCYLAMGAEILCCREDIGRHNALDKAVGWACAQGVDLRKCLLFTTGRMPSDMVSKAIRSGVPLLASKTYPSDLGIEMARQSGLTLITLRPNGDFCVWNDGTECDPSENQLQEGER